ncbi:GldG family protein [candidate division KSB1 bacterium]|nr:GldG family protein [candidate division KSB1 bacterium]
MKDLKTTFLITFITGAVLLAGIIILVNMIFDNLNFGRFDLTAEQLYKISPAVEKIFDKLEAPIQLTYYVSSSEKMPTKWKNLERDVIDKLNELKMASNGKLDYAVFDPTVEEEKEAVEFEKMEEEAEESQDVLKAREAEQKKQSARKKIAEKLYEKGVIPFGVQSTAQDEFAIKRVYSSIVLSYLDRKEDVIAEIRPETFGSLEYEIMSRIYKLISNERPKIAFYPSDPEMPPYMRQQPYYPQQKPPDYYEYPVKFLRESGYDVTRTNIKKDDPIPEGIKTLVLMIDQPLNDRQMYEIEKALHKGVNVIFAAQSFNFNIRAARPNEFQVYPGPTNLNTNTMTRNWGFELEQKIFLDNSCIPFPVQVYQTRKVGFLQLQEQRIEYVQTPVAIKVSSENISRETSISNMIDDLLYIFGSNLDLVEEKLESENIANHAVLFTSSDQSWTRESYSYQPVNTTEPDRELMLKHQPLGIFVEGTFESSYKDKEPPQWPKDPGQNPDADQDAADVPEEKEELGTSKPAKIIAYGCSYLFKSMLMEQMSSHKALLLNSVDALTLGDELINIRSKNIVARRLKTTSMTEKFWTKVFVIWFTPLVFVAIGIYLAATRTTKVREKIKRGGKA